MTRSLSDHLALLLGQWFYSGRARTAPGTVGSLFALPLFLAARQLSLPVYWLLTAVVSVGGIFVSNRCAKLLGDKDPSSVVIDEVAGVMIAMGCVMHASNIVLTVAWGLFRVLDITKPWLIYRVQFLKPDGLGIMADDILAGAVAGALSFGLSILLGSGSATL